MLSTAPAFACVSPRALIKPVDLQREASLELLAVRVGKTEVDKDVAATLSDPDFVVLHLNSAFLRSPVLPRRAAG